jgi:hypothetical protein
MGNRGAKVCGGTLTGNSAYDTPAPPPCLEDEAANEWQNRATAGKGAGGFLCFRQEWPWFAPWTPP